MCCVTSNGVCAPPNQGENCPSGSVTHYYPCSSLGSQCKVIVSDVSQFTLPTPATKTEAAKKTLKFIPNITIPGSITIGGKKYEFIAGQPVTIDNMTIGMWISLFYTFFCGVVGILAAVNIIWGGYKYITSFGNASRMSDAKDTIYSALFGIVLAVGAYIILYTINPNLVKFESLNIKSISTIATTEEGNRSEKGAPAVAWNNKNKCTYDKILDQAANANGIDRNRLKALMLIESSGQADAVSPAGACGLLQLMPDTAKRVCKEMITPPTNCDQITCETLKNAEINAMLAAKLYSDLLSSTCPSTANYKNGETVSCFAVTNPACKQDTNCKNGAIDYANAAYNAGQGANCCSVTCTGMTWWECPSNEGFAETRTYVQKAQDAYNKITTDPSFNWNIDCPQ